MIKIIVEKEPFYTDIGGCMNEPYTTNAEFKINEDASIDEALAPFIKALSIEGYSNLINASTLINAIETLSWDGVVNDDYFKKND